jgi:6-pyruvoyltetrahydropterin/6-carboxytetrahydropterin synthase
MNVELSREFTFEAAHINRAAPSDAPNARLHGHSYRAMVAISGPVDEHLGWVTDFADIKRICKPVIARLDHQVLNDIGGMTDSSCADVERWIGNELKRDLPDFSRCALSIIGDTTFRPEIRANGGDQRVAFGFAGAHYLPRLPESHKCRRMHGHSFQIEVAGADSAPLLDAIERVYPRLDHRVLNEIDGLENPTSEVLAHWLWREFSTLGCTIDEVLVKETCTTCCRYRGEE